MIAVADTPASSMVCLYRSLRGYVNGNTEPVDFTSVPGGTVEDSLMSLGASRVSEWAPVPGQPRAWYAEVQR